uniref:Hexosyltransferase n=1 Tax=Bursaphelenchus xylophilus TaxID=6326 RepID=A0A1I7SND6_BURXY
MLGNQLTFAYNREFKRWIWQLDVANEISRYVPVREYAYDLYPPYCYGYAVIMSTLAVNLSIDAMKEVNMFHMDDVLYTGVVAPLRDIQLYDFKGIRTQISGHIHESEKRKSFCKIGLPYPIALHNAKSPTSMHYSYELLRKMDCITNPNAYHKRPYTFYEN